MGHKLKGQMKGQKSPNLKFKLRKRIYKYTDTSILGQKFAAYEMAIVLKP